MRPSADLAGRGSLAATVSCSLTRALACIFTSDAGFSKLFSPREDCSHPSFFLEILSHNCRVSRLKSSRTNSRRLIFSSNGQTDFEPAAILTIIIIRHLEKRAGVEKCVSPLLSTTRKWATKVQNLEQEMRQNNVVFVFARGEKFRQNILIPDFHSRLLGLCV